MGEVLVERLLEVDPADLASWFPVVRAGGRVLLPDVPGSLPLVREAVACGLVALVPVGPDGAVPEVVEAAATTLAAGEPDPGDVAAVVAVLADRLGRGEGAHPDPRTAPRALLLAFGKGELRRLGRAARTLQAWGAATTLVVSRSTARAEPALVPTAGQVVQVDDPASTWWPARAERLLVLLLPRLATAVLRRAARLLAARAPGPARPVAARAVPAVAALDGRRRSASTRVHERGWGPVVRRVRPALVSRRVTPLLPDLVGDLDDLDLVCGPGADSLTVVWRLLRDHPTVAASTSPSRRAVADLVLARTRALAATLGPDGSAEQEGVAQQLS